MLNGSYVLKFDSRCTWNLVATDGTNRWLDGLAEIMGLQPGYLANYPTIRYIPATAPLEMGRFDISEPDFQALCAAKKKEWQASCFPWLRTWSDRQTRELFCELSNASPRHAKTQMWLSLNPVYQGIMRCGGIPLHAALVEHLGRAFLLAGNHGVGKSTCCRRLPSPWTALSDDEAFVLAGRQGYYAHPMPTWSAYLSQISQPSLDVSRRAPLSAVFFLEKASRDEVVPIGQGEAALRILKSAREAFIKRMNGFDRLSKRSPKTRLFENACKLAREIPAYMLRVSKTGEFWKAIEALLDDDVNEQRVPEESGHTPS